MNQQDIIKVAREADLAEVADTLESLPIIYYAESLIKFATLAYQRGVRDEREACAKVCDSIADKWERRNWDDREDAADECAIAIRARNNKDNQE